MPRLRYHSLPGVSNRDPNFHDGAYHADRGRFAQPVSTGYEPATGQDEPNVAFPAPYVDVPSNDYAEVINPSPFKLGG